MRGSSRSEELLDLMRTFIITSLLIPNEAGLEATLKGIWRTRIKYQFCFIDNGTSRQTNGIKKANPILINRYCYLFQLSARTSIVIECQLVRSNAYAISLYWNLLSLLCIFSRHALLSNYRIREYLFHSRISSCNVTN